MFKELLLAMVLMVRGESSGLGGIKRERGREKISEGETRLLQKVKDRLRIVSGTEKHISGRV